MNRKLTLVSILVLAVLLIVAPASAAIDVASQNAPDDCLDFYNFSNHAVCFMGAEPDGNGNTTWTYAVRTNTNFSGTDPVPNGGESIQAIECHPVIAELSLSVCPNTVVTPADGSTYTTIASYGSLTSDVKSGVVFDVTHLTTGSVPDVTTQVVFDNQNYQNALGYSDQWQWGIFQFTQPTQANPGTQLNPMQLASTISHYSSEPTPTVETGAILGPVCDGTSAVEISSFSASSGLFARIASWFGLR